MKIKPKQIETKKVIGIILYRTIFKKRGFLNRHLKYCHIIHFIFNHAK